MPIVYFGTSDFAAALLRDLAAPGSPRRPVLVVTPPDRRQGRGRRLSPPPVAAVAAELGIELLQTERTDDLRALERIRAAGPDVGVVCAFGQILRRPILSELVLLNVHPSLLPRWRGAAPIERSIIAGDDETGVSIMRVTEGVDCGPVALQEAIAIGDDDFGALSARLQQLGSRLLSRALDLRAEDRLEAQFVEQDDSAATYAEKVEPAERRLDPARPAIELERVVRALTPHIGAYIELVEEQRLTLTAATAEAGEAGQGELVADGDDLVLGAADGVLRISELRPAGKQTMAASAYLRGCEAPPQLASGA